MTNIRLGYAIGSLRQNADRVRTEAVARAHRANQDLFITCAGQALGPASALVSASESGRTLWWSAPVAGAQGGLLLRSISVQVASHARAPVVVVHDTSAPVGAPVVVEVDGLALSKDAIAYAYAYAQASSRGVGSTVVHGGGWSTSKAPRPRPSERRLAEFRCEGAGPGCPVTGPLAGEIP
jgi:hypothetical protein